jgi:hypothetical protein
VGNDFGHHRDYTDDLRRPLLDRLLQQVRSWDKGLIETVTAEQRIAYKKPGGRIFLEVKVQRSAIRLHMVDVPDPDGLLLPIPQSHDWKQLSRQATIRTSTDLERLLPLARTAWLRGG